MPIDFGNADTLNRTRRLFENPTGWGSRVIQMLTTAFGPDNVFGTAATLDTGTAGGEIPLIDSNGSLVDVIGDATTERRGVSTLRALESPADVQSVLGAAIGTIGGSALAVRHVPRRLVSGSRTSEKEVDRLDLTRDHSLLLISAAAGNVAILDLFGILRMQSVSLMPDATGESDIRVHINSGRPPLIENGVIDESASATSYLTLDGTSEDETGETMQFLSPAQLQAFGLAWGFRLRHFGARAGEPYGLGAPGRQSRYLTRQFTERRDADLLIAYKPGASSMFYETNLTDQTRFLPTAHPFASFSSGSSAGANGFAVEILL